MLSVPEDVLTAFVPADHHAALVSGEYRKVFDLHGQRAVALLARTECLLGLGAFDPVGGLACELIDDAQLPICRMVGLAAVGGQDADEPTGAGEQRRGLDAPDS